MKFCQATYNDFYTFLHVCYYASKEFTKVERRRENIIIISVLVSSHSTKKSCSTKEVSLASQLFTGWHFLGECTKIQDVGLRFFKSKNFVLSMAQSWLRETKYYLNSREIAVNFSGGTMTKTLHSQHKTPGSIPGQGARYHKPQLKILHSTTKTNKYINFFAMKTLNGFHTNQTY